MTGQLQLQGRLTAAPDGKAVRSIQALACCWFRKDAEGCAGVMYIDQEPRGDGVKTPWGL